MNDGLQIKQPVHKKFADLLVEVGIPFKYKKEKHGGLDSDVITIVTDDSKATISFVALDTGEAFFMTDNIK